MNIIFVTDDSREADAFKSKLTQAAPPIQVEICPNILNATLRLGTPGICDIVVLDTSVSVGEVLKVILFIRQDKKPIGIVALIGAEEKEPPSDLLKSGVDHFLAKTPGYITPLPEMFQQLHEHYHAGAARRNPVRLLYAGNIEMAQRCLANAHQLKLVPAQTGPDGTLQLPDSAAPPVDAFVMDYALTGAQTLKLIKEAAQHLPDVPIILFTNPGDDDLVFHAMRTGAADCIAKDGNYFRRLLLVLQREIARRELINERKVLRTRQERLRQIVENMPAGIVVIAPDGGVLAINEVGLKLIGAARLDQVVGKNVADLIQSEDRERIINFVSTVCKGSPGSICLGWKGMAGTNLRTEFRAVPMSRDAMGSTAALVVLFPDAGSRSGENSIQDGNKREETAKEIESKLLELTERQLQQKLKWEAALQESESRRAAAEEQQERLKRIAEEAATQHKLLLQEQQAERENWEKTRQGFNEQCLRIEEVAQSLRSAQANLIESHSAEQAKWDLQRQELDLKHQTAEQLTAELSQSFQTERSDWQIVRSEMEGKYLLAEGERARLESALRSAESSLEQHSQEHTEILAGQGLAQTELERKYQLAEEQRIARETALETALETGLHDAEQRIVRLEEAHSAELSQRDNANRQLEQTLEESEKQRVAIQAALDARETSLGELIETHNAELAQRAHAYAELEERRKLAEEQRIASETALETALHDAHDAEQRIVRLEEAHSAELSQRDNANRQLEQTLEESEKQRVAIQAALGARESSLGELIETHNAELSQRAHAYAELEERRKFAEEQRIERETALETALHDAHDAEQRIVRLEEAHSAELSQRDNANRQLEQTLEESEKQRVAIQAALDARESSLGELIETHNAELSQRAHAYAELEERRKLAEEQRIARETALETALHDAHDAEQRIVRLEETRIAELSQRDNAYRQLEQTLEESEKQRVAIQAALDARESSLGELIETHNAELSQRDHAYAELEEKRQLAEEQSVARETALHEAEQRIVRLEETRLAELSQRDNANRQLEQTLEESEKQRVAIQAALGARESSLGELIETHNAELSQRDHAYAELEERRKLAEEQRIERETALETALNDAEQRIVRLEETRIAELSQRDNAYRQLEQTLDESEKQRVAIQAALGARESSLGELIETHNAELAQRDHAYAELEEKRQLAEEQRIARETALHEAEQRIVRLEETRLAELSQRDNVYRQLEQTLEESEKQRAAIQAALGARESSLGELIETHNAELAQRDHAYAELEQSRQLADEKCIALESTIQNADERITQLMDAHGVELSQRDSACRELDQKCESLQTQTLLLQSAIDEANASLAQAIETGASELARSEFAYQELEQKYRAAESQNIALQAAIQDERSSLAEIAAKHDAEISKRDLACQELEQLLQLAEQEIQTLKCVSLDIQQITESHNAEISRRDLVQSELETKFQTADQQIIFFQNALHEAASSLTQLVEKHNIELSQHDFAQKKSEQKYQMAEKQRLALEDSLHETESRLAQLTETVQNERTQWDVARQELEQKYQTAEKQQVVALQNAARETESRLAWISEQNQSKAAQLEEMQHEIEQLREECKRLETASSDFYLRNQRLSRLTSVGVLLTRKDGQVLECNDAAAQIFGYSNAAEALSRDGQEQFRIYAFEGALDRRLQQDGKLENIEWSALGNDGRLIRIQENSALVESPTGDDPLVERILTDISKIYKLSEEVRRARRVESTGDLAAAAVKSLKELCSSLAHSGELLLQSTADPEAVRQLAETLLSDANRGVKHARQFLSVALKTDRAPALLNINEMLTSNDALLRSLIGEDIDLQIVLAPRIGLASVDRNDLIQLVGNFLASSRDVLPLGGAVTIETSNIEIDSISSDYPAGLKPGIYVQMAFSADGCAVQPERRMGSARTLVERIGGYLETVNDPNLGNIHKVYLPRAEAGVGHAAVLSNTASA